MFKANDAEIITIGDELLIGQVVDTNSAWIAQKLNMLGIDVRQISSVPDSEEEIIKAIQDAEARAGIILITGGLGPTKDDITKKTLCKYFDGKLVVNHAQLQQIESIFSKLNRPLTELNRKQAEVPDTCTCIVNKAGTAPGMWFERNAHVCVSMPGVPFEMKSMVEHAILPLLQQKFSFPPIIHRTFLTQGVPESTLAEIIEDWENALPPSIKLAYLPSPGQVRLRLTARGMKPEEAKKEMDLQAAQLYKLIAEHIYDEGDTCLPEAVHQLMIKNKLSLSLAESCTGGQISQMLTELPACSTYYKGGAVVYSNELKMKILGVTEEALNQHGAVSQRTAKEMAEGAQRNFQTDYAVAVTGIAGPDGGSETKPVGTVWIAVAGKQGVELRLLNLSGSRSRIITVSALSALHLLLKILRKENH